MALCGEGSPITFNINVEHHQLLSRLECLRYVTADGQGGVAVPDRIREAAVSEIGREISQILSKVQTLLAEEWKAVGKAGSKTGHAGSQMVHLRLILSGSELSLIPFEMAIAPQAFPGEALELALQSHIPVALTREIRRNRPPLLRWDHTIKPTILFISAAPAGLDIPLQSHVNALRSAVEPWVRWPKRTNKDKPSEPGPHEIDRQRLPLIKERLRLLPNASIESIYEICSKQQFTHVHILAHGDYSDVGGERRFGLALCKHGNPALKEVVSGKRLAEALQAEGKNGSCRSQPLMVTLMTCDSGNPGSVLVPGGSIAHDLHAAGIPWVFASQFPLTKAGSVRITSGLYPRILRGEDPRQALYEVRRKLHMSAER
ncbi:MAG: CHAT domain-containing protein, partial [Nitrospirota bacterium]